MISDLNIHVNSDLCIACDICVDRCIMDNLRLNIPPCRIECPLHMNCQGYIRLLARGKEEQAAEELRKYTPFGSSRQDRRPVRTPEMRGTLINFVDRPSDSPFIERVWRSHSHQAGVFHSVASCHWNMVVTLLEGRTTLTVRGPETKATLYGGSTRARRVVRGVFQARHLHAPHAGGRTARPGRRHPAKRHQPFLLAERLGLGFPRL